MSRRYVLMMGEIGIDFRATPSRTKQSRMRYIKRRNRRRGDQKIISMAKQQINAGWVTV